MTDPVGGVNRTNGSSSGGRYSDEHFSGERKKRKAEVPEGDLVEISQDARDRFSGKKRKGILEYLRDLLP
jgi:hypothetical protein